MFEFDFFFLLLLLRLLLYYENCVYKIRLVYSYCTYWSISLMMMLMTMLENYNSTSLSHTHSLFLCRSLFIFDRYEWVVGTMQFNFRSLWRNIIFDKFYWMYRTLNHSNRATGTECDKCVQWFSMRSHFNQIQSARIHSNILCCSKNLIKLRRTISNLFDCKLDRFV
jgi:hypothetical protein